MGHYDDCYERTEDEHRKKVKLAAKKRRKIMEKNLKEELHTKGILGILVDMIDSPQNYRDEISRERD